MRRTVCVLVTLVMVLAPLMAVIPTVAAGYGTEIPISVSKEARTVLKDGEYVDITDFDYHGVCTDKTSWVISSNVVCTSSTFSVANYVTISSSGTLTLESNTVMNMNVPSVSWSYMVTVQGTLNVMNSTIKSATATQYYGVYAYASKQVRYEGATIKNFYYYGLYGYSASKIMVNNSHIDGSGAYTYSYPLYAGMSQGYIMNSTINNGYYCVMLDNIMNMAVLNNTFRNSQYGVYFYSFNGQFHDNIVRNHSYYGLYLYNSRPTFTNNYIHSNSQAGLFLYSSNDITVKNCTIINNNQRDIWLEGSKTRIINSEFSKVGIDVNGWGGTGSELQVYWYSNASVKWLSDGSPVTGAEVSIEDSTGQSHETDLFTNSNGEVNWVPLMEYKQTKTGKVDITPHYVNATGEVEGREIMNFSKLSVSKNNDNNVELFLDNVPPPLVIASPEDGLLTNSTAVTISGRTENFVDKERPVTVQVRLKGVTYEPKVGIDGSFSQEVALPTDGTHEFTINAYDWVMNEVSTTIHVKRDTKAPELDLKEPANELLTNISTVKVAGTTEPGVTLTVNDVVVTVEDDGDWSTDVDLAEGENFIVVRSMDEAQNWVEKSRYVTLDTIPPSLIVSEPIDGIKTNDRNLRVAGLTEQYSHVTLNGAPVLVAGAGFQTNFQLAEGENRLFIESMDAAGNRNSTVLKVYLDTIPPKLELYKPTMNNLLTNAETIEVAGYVDPGAKLLIERVDVGMEGEWTYTVELREGKNKITVEAIDDVGNKITIARTVIRDSTPPMLAIFSPENERTFSEPNIMVEGSVEPGANLTIDDKPVGTVGGIFSSSMDLKEGENVITLRAVDVAGNVRTQTLTVFLDTKVNLDVDTSMDGKTVQKANLTVEGQTDKGARVHVNGEPVEVRADGKFKHNLNLMEGENIVLVQAHDEYGNEKHTEMKVTLRTPGGGIGTVGSDIGGKDNMWTWILVLVIMVVCITAIVAHNVVSRRNARKAEEQVEADIQAAAIKSETEVVYEQLYGPSSPGDQPTYGPEDKFAGYAPISTTDDIPTASGTAIGTQYNITEGAQMKLDEAANRIKRYQADGRDTSGAERNLRLGKQFAARGNSEKAESYADKALDQLQDDV